MFYRAESGIWRAAPLDEFPWLEHGFGSRQTDPTAGNLATLRQIHSDRVVRAEVPGRLGEGDALVTEVAGLGVGVRTADCLPILLVDPERRAVAAVHAGWRGTLAGVAVRAVESLGRLFGSRAGAIRAAIGPGIQVCCYEVGPEVAIQFRNFLPEPGKIGGKIRLDLVAINRQLLAGAGLAPRHVYSGAPCTCCSGDEFHSWRRNRETAGRMLSFAKIRG